MNIDAAGFLLTVSRAAKVAQPEDLVGPVEQLVRTLQEEGEEFVLFGRSPAHHEHPVLQGGRSLVPNFLTTSDIEWNFGRQPADPTHQVVFRNKFEDGRGVFVKVAFSVEEPEDGIETTGPGLVAELQLGRDAAGVDEADRVRRLERYLNLLADLFAADTRSLESSDAEE